MERPAILDNVKEWSKSDRMATLRPDQAKEVLAYIEWLENKKPVADLFWDDGDRELGFTDVEDVTDGLCVYESMEVARAATLSNIWAVCLPKATATDPFDDSEVVYFDNKEEMEAAIEAANKRDLEREDEELANL